MAKSREDSLCGSAGGLGGRYMCPLVAGGGAESDGGVCAMGGVVGCFLFAGLEFGDLLGGGVLHSGLFGVLALLVLEGMRVMLGKGGVGNGGVIRELPAAVGMSGGLGSTLDPGWNRRCFPWLRLRRRGFFV